MSGCNWHTQELKEIVKKSVRVASRVTHMVGFGEFLPPAAVTSYIQMKLYLASVYEDGQNKLDGIFKIRTQVISEEPAKKAPKHLKRKTPWQ